MKFVPYINLAGNAEEALNYYKGIFGGSAEIMRWGEMPPDEKMPISEDWKSKVMHASLIISEDVSIYLSDSLVDGQDADAKPSSSVVIHINFETEAELRRGFESLADGGQVNMPVDTMFWGAVYGDLVDRFGIGWGFHYQPPA